VKEQSPHITASERAPVLGMGGWLLRYVAAVVASAVALGATAVLRPYIGDGVFLFSFAAVALSGALGFGPGALATLVCVAGVHYFFIPPVDSFRAAQPSDFVSLAVFLLVALFISGLASRLRHARLAAQVKQSDAECLSKELEQQARELEDQAHELEEQAAQLAHAEAFNRTIVESFGEPMVVHDAEWRFEYINEPATRIFKTSKHHLPGSLIGENLWTLYPDIVDHAFGINLRRSMAERVPVTFEAYYPERAEWTDVRCYPLPSGGLVTVWKSITERRQAEEAQRYLSEASALLGKSLDYEETLTSLANLVIPDLADWSRVDMVDGNGSPRVLAVAHTDPEKVRWARDLAEKYPTDMSAPGGLPNVLRTGIPEMYPDITEEMLAEGTEDPEYLALLKTVKFQGVIIAPIVSTRGVLGAFTLVSAESRRRYTDRDVALAVELGRRAGMAVENSRVHNAERVAREAAVEARRAAEDANAAKSQFLAFMSHELRTPLNAIAGYVDLILAGVHGPVTDGQREALDRVKRSQRALLGLINNVLNFVRLDAGHVELNLSDVAAVDILKEVEPLVVPQLEAKGIEYDFECDGGALVHADPEKTQQILLNLLSNAIKFTDKGGSITVRCRSEERRVKFAVRDTGCGIAPEKHNAIFEPFVQLDRTLKSGHEGVGLGLAISRDLALQMKGTLTVESVVGQGCTFVLSLPAGDGEHLSD
jgi:signal transduction histidine kinase/PAS domain-containing protein